MSQSSHSQIINEQQLLTLPPELTSTPNQTVQSLQETALINNMVLILVVLLLNQLIDVKDAFTYKFKIIVVSTYVCCLILIQLCPQAMSKNCFKYVIYLCFLIGKLFSMWIICKSQIFKQFLMLLMFCNFTVYYFIKTTHKLRGMNELNIREYIPNILVINAIYAYIMLSELLIKYWYFFLYYPFCLLMTCYIILNLQLVMSRHYLQDNVDPYMTTMLMDADILMPGKFLELHVYGIKAPEKLEEIMKEPESYSFTESGDEEAQT